MKKPEDITHVEDLLGYTVVAADDLGPLIIWDGDKTLAHLSIHKSGAQLSHKGTRVLEQSGRAIAEVEGKRWFKEVDSWAKDDSY